MNTVSRSMVITLALGRTNDESSGIDEKQVFTMRTQTDFSAVGLTNESLDEYISIFMENASRAFFDRLRGGMPACHVETDPFDGKGHGLDMPPDEEPEHREARINAEMMRQSGYNDGVCGKPAEWPGDSYYTLGWSKGNADHPEWQGGYSDAENGRPADTTDYAYTVGYYAAKAKTS